MAPPAPRATRGRPAVVGRDRIGTAALELGPDTATLTAVARHLGVHHSTLYGHVADRADLACAAADVLARTASWPGPHDDWRTLLVAFGDTFWAMFDRYPGSAELIQALPAPPQVAVERMVALQARLVELGFAADDALLALDFVADLAVDTAVGMRRLDREAQTRAWGRAPAMVEAIVQPRGWYERKLAILLDGLAVRVGPGPAADA